MLFPLCCRYDILVGRSPKMGNSTRMFFQSHISLVDDLQPGVYDQKLHRALCSGPTCLHNLCFLPTVQWYPVDGLHHQ